MCEARPVESAGLAVDELYRTMININQVELP